MGRSCLGLGGQPAVNLTACWNAILCTLKVGNKARAKISLQINPSNFPPYFLPRSRFLTPFEFGLLWLHFVSHKLCGGGLVCSVSSLPWWVGSQSGCCLPCLANDTPLMMCHRDMDVAPPRCEPSGLTLAVSQVSCLDASHAPNNHNLSMATGYSSALENAAPEGSAPAYIAATAAELVNSAVPSSHHMAVIQSQHMANGGTLAENEAVELLFHSINKEVIILISTPCLSLSLSLFSSRFPAVRTWSGSKIFTRAVIEARNSEWERIQVVHCSCGHCQANSSTQAG